MNKQKYIKWYKIAHDTINDENIIPALSDDDIIELASEEDWLMFVLKQFVSTTEAKNAPAPNCFMAIYSDSNKDYCRIGVTFNNIRAVDRLKNILNKHCKGEKDRLTELLLELDGAWEIAVKRKIKEHNWQETPKYVTEFQVSSNQTNEKIVDEIISWVEKIRAEGVEKRLSSTTYYMETPSVNIMEITFELNEAEFRKRILEAFSVLNVCLDIKSDGAIKIIAKSKKKQRAEFEAELKGKLRKIEFYLKTGLGTEEQFKILNKEIDMIEEKIMDLSEEI